jgi:predicted translation initiation factor SUI1
MAKPQRTILFLARQESAARNAAALFAESCKRLGLSWKIEAKESAASLNRSAADGVTVVVAVDLPDFTIPHPNTKLERLASTPSLHQAVNGLMARLLGGSDAPTVDKPPPPPPPKKLHTVKLSRETAGRKGKGVTIVSDLPLSEDELKELATQLKNKCGTGGTAKDGRIEIQGDHRDKLAAELEKLGYKVKRAGG